MNKTKLAIIVASLNILPVVLGVFVEQILKNSKPDIYKGVFDFSIGFFAILTVPTALTLGLMLAGIFRVMKSSRKSQYIAFVLPSGLAAFLYLFIAALYLGRI